ncbi:MAG TPA: CDC48 family AAA ATPase, partial [Thermoplasmata archaeon]|nr:CDC48 family AAA ATPase [Thermoplasmata archaeon]
IAVKTQPRGIAQIVESTDIIIKDEPVKESEVQRPHTSYEDIGGLKEELRRVREMIELPLKHPELFERLGIDPPKGVLLFGPPGTGKTLIARAVANEAGANFYSIQGPEIMSKYYGQSEERLREKFQEAEQNPPAVLFIDELDSIAPKRDEVQGEVERRVVAQLLTLMDGLSSRGNLIVIAATNREDAIDPALRRPGRFDREIEIGVPDRVGRKEILMIHSRGMPIEDGDAEEKDKLLDELAQLTHGFVGADMAALCREAAMKTLRRYLPEIDLEKPVPNEVLEKMRVMKHDFHEALREVEPSSLREVFIEIPRVSWSDVGGLDDVKDQLREVVELPLTNPAAFKQVGIKPVRGVLLYGPPGTGKTMLAKAVAHESQANFISIKGPEVISKWVGESEKGVRMIFRKAKQAAPSIIFLDELDAVASRRGSGNDSGVTERVVNQLLTSMDGIEGMEGVVIIGATNRPDMIDPALLRPGRFDRVIFVPPPDEKSRLAILKVHTKDMPLGADVVLEDLAKKLESYSGADLNGLVREAGMAAIRERSVKVVMRHFDVALKKVGGSCDPETVKYYQSMAKALAKGLLEKKQETLRYIG